MVSDTRVVRNRVRGLDGLRGLALLGMLGWHAQLDWVRGGFARMTIFFVLSGYLAARSLLRTGDGVGIAQLRRFWGRRARRLLPMTLVGVASAIAVTVVWGASAARNQVFGDTVSVLTSWSNWRFLFQERSYAELFQAPSAFQHFWSLSVEEQCLIVFPLVCWALSRVSGRRRLDAALGVVGAAICAVPLVIVMAPDTAYYGTHVRVGEFLLGAALGVAWPSGVPEVGSRARGWLGAAGAAGLLSLVVVMATVDPQSSWVYRGGMGLMAVPVLAVIAAVVQDSGPAPRVLSLRPLCALGRAAFSIYVIHWPIYQAVEAVLDQASRNVVVVVELSVSLFVGFVCYRLIERPLMPDSRSAVGQRWRRRSSVLAVAALGGTCCVSAAAAVPRAEPEIDFASLNLAQRDLSELTVEQAAWIVTSSDPRATIPPFARDSNLVGIGLFGGSTALTWALGADRWEQGTPRWAEPTRGYSPLGCGVLDEGVRGGAADPGNQLDYGPVPPECRAPTIRWAAAAKAFDVQAAVIVASISDLTRWRFATGDPWRVLGDDEFDRRLAQGLVDAIAQLRAVGVQQVLLSTPMAARNVTNSRAAKVRADRIERYSRLVRAVAKQHDAVVVDVWGWSSSLSDSQYSRYVPDGVHFSVEGSAAAWDELLGPALESLRDRGALRAPAEQ